MAEALLRAAAGGRFDVLSAGTAATGSVEGVGQVLEEIGIGQFRAARRLLGDLVTPPPDLLVAVCEEGCDSCPYVPGAARVMRWPQPDPDLAPAADRLSVLRGIREDLQLRVAYLVNLPEYLAQPG